MFNFIYIITMIFFWVLYMAVMFCHDMSESKKNLNSETFYSNL